MEEGVYICDAYLDNGEVVKDLTFSNDTINDEQHVRRRVAKYASSRKIKSLKIQPKYKRHFNKRKYVSVEPIVFNEKVQEKPLAKNKTLFKAPVKKTRKRKPTPKNILGI